MQLPELLQYLEQHGIRKVKLAAADLDGVLRGKYISLAKFAHAAEKGFGFCDVVFGWDVEDATYDFPSVTGWHTGFPDALAQIDLDTLRLHPWEPGTALFLCDFWEDEQSIHPVCPRNLLKKVLFRAEALGYRVRAAFEYEFWLFQETPHSLREKGFHGLTPLTPGSFGYSIIRAGQNSDLIHDLIDAAAALQVDVEGIHTETGPGVYEVALAAADGLAAADKAILFKTMVKEVAARHGCVATFMARWAADLPGSGGHLHQSLWALDQERNLFHDPEKPGGLSDLLDAYVAGQLALMPEWTVLVAPTINSYRRLVPGAWAPTNATWGVENRTAALRVVPGVSEATARVEYRTAGADANPYLALAGSVAAGLYGIDRQLELIEPVTGNAYEADAPQLPRNLRDATAAFRPSAPAREYFGAEFVRHFAASRDWEVRQSERAVTDWELRRYFEII